MTKTKTPPLPITPKRALLAGGLFIAGLIFFTYIRTSVTQNSGLALLDQPILQWMIAHRSPELTTFMQFITNLFSPVGLSAITLAVGAVWYRQTKEYWQPAILAGSMFAAFALTGIIKHLVERLRPPFIHMSLPFEVDFGFPSGHAISISVFVLVLGYFIYSRSRTISTLIAVAAAGSISIFTVAVSRLYLGYHWLTDVSASFGLALIILAVVILVDVLRPPKT